MLSTTTAIAASLSVSAGSANPSNYSRLLGLNSNLSYTASNPVIVSSNFDSFSWSTGNNNKYRKSRMERFTTRVSAQPLTNADELIDSVRTFIFDCDGVIWKGDKLIDGVPETLDLLRSKGKRLVFVTNNSTKSRKQYGKKFDTLGLNVNEEEIFASSFAAAAYLKSINFPKDKKVYVIGEEGILKELELAGYQYLGGPEDSVKRIDLKPGFLMEHDENVGAVVVGFDRNFSYYKIQQVLVILVYVNASVLNTLQIIFVASALVTCIAVFSGGSQCLCDGRYGTLCICENPGCLFIATNRDAVTHLTDAQEWAESVLAESVQNLNEKIDRIEEC